MEMAEALEGAKKQLMDATGLKPITVTRAFVDEQGWHMVVEMLEMSRIPSATDVLGAYDVLLSKDGCMLRFDRKRTRLRCESAEDERE